MCANYGSVHIMDDDDDGGLTRVFVLGLVHLAVGALSDDADDVKLIDASLAPVALGVFTLAVARATNPAGIYKNKKRFERILASQQSMEQNSQC